jgi:hypothetical protein
MNKKTLTIVIVVGLIVVSLGIYLSSAHKKPLQSSIVDTIELSIIESLEIGLEQSELIALVGEPVLIRGSSMNSQIWYYSDSLDDIEDYLELRMTLKNRKLYDIEIFSVGYLDSFTQWYYRSADNYKKRHGLKF